MGMREQLTFYPEPLGGMTVAPSTSTLDGFVFGKDKGGDEFSQLYWFDFASRSTSLLTDGKRTQNGGALFSRDGAAWPTAAPRATAPTPTSGCATSPPAQARVW
jgi:hypothetical protein